MARVNVYLPDDLAEQARAAGLNVSGLTQDAVRSALAADRTDEWLDTVARLPRSAVSRADVAAALVEAKGDFERPRG